MKEKANNPTKYNIVSDVPSPEPFRYGRKYPLGDMDIGDSFFSTERRDRLSSMASWYGKRNGKKFSVRQESDGFRVFRLQ